MKPAVGLGGRIICAALSVAGVARGVPPTSGENGAPASRVLGLVFRFPLASNNVWPEESETCVTRLGGGPTNVIPVVSGEPALPNSTSPSAWTCRGHRSWEGGVGKLVGSVTTRPSMLLLIELDGKTPQWPSESTWIRLLWNWDWWKEPSIVLFSSPPKLNGSFQS